jgi:hypothetical protein
MLVTGIVTGVSLWIPMRILDKFVFDTTRTVPLAALTLISSLIGFSAYLLFSYLFRVEQLHFLFLLIKRMGDIRYLILPKTKEALIVSAPDQN